MTGCCSDVPDLDTRHRLQVELTDYWRLIARRLERWRCAGIGPAWLQLNGRVAYRVVDVLAFEQARREGD